MSAITFYTGHAETVERGIRVGMLKAITLPVLREGRDTGVAVYVCFSDFASLATGTTPTDDQLRAVAALIVRAVEQYRPP